MSDLKRYLPGSSQDHDRKTVREFKAKREERGREDKEIKNERRSVKKKETRSGREMKSNRVLVWDKVKIHRPAVALFLALLMTFSVVVPSAGAVTDDGGRSFFIESSQTQPIENSYESSREDASRLFRSTNFLTQILTGMNTGWYISVFSDNGFLQQIWVTLNLFNGETELSTEVAVQEAGRRLSRSSDSSDSSDELPDGDPDTIPDVEQPEVPGEADEPVDPDPGISDGGNEGGSDEGHTGGNGSGEGESEKDEDEDENEDEEEITLYTLTLTIQGNGTVTNNVYMNVTGGSEAMEAGTEVKLVAVPAEGYDFFHWTELDEDEIEIELGTGHEYTIESLAKDKNITAHFRAKSIPQKYDVSVTSSNGGSASLLDGSVTGAFEAGESVTVVATPNDLFAFSHLSIVDNTEIELSMEDTNSFKMPATNITVMANFVSTHPFEGGTGQVNDPYQIKTAPQLAQLMGNNPQLTGYAEFGLETNLMQAHYKLVDHIDMEGIEWIPIGGTGANPSEDALFKGSFNGNDKTIKNLTINQPDKSYQAMFHTIGEDSEGKKGIIKNLTLLDPFITAKSHAAVLAVNNHGTVERVVVRTSKTPVSPLNQNPTDPAGPVVVVGEKATDYYIYGAGLVSTNGPNGTILESGIIASIDVVRKQEGRYAGLLVAENKGDVIQSFAIGSIDKKAPGGSSFLLYQGGIVGINRNVNPNGNANIIDSYAIVSQFSAGIYRGGVVGHQSSQMNPDGSSSIQRVYAVTKFSYTGDARLGGVIGGDGGQSARALVETYFDSDFYSTNVTDKGTPTPTLDMINTTNYFVKDDEQKTWDFSTIWAIDSTKVINKGYPYLKWQYLNNQTE